jgi:hypothetical protein
MRYVVTYRRTPIQLPDGRWTTDSFLVRDREAVPAVTASTHATREAAAIAAAALNDS